MIIQMPIPLLPGYGLYEYFKTAGKNVRLVYGGRWQITKPNLVEMVKALEIPIEYVENLEVKGLLITVDCQYGAGNLKKFVADEVAIIDHHQQEIFNVELSDIRHYLGSCSTLVWQLLKQEKFDFNNHQNVTTALYYGLFTDTNNLVKLSSIR